MNRILQKFQELKHKNEKGLIIFLTAGDPDLSTTYKLILECEHSGADIIELGVPFSDPIADGPIIQASSQRALKKGVNLDNIFSTVEKIRKRSQIPLIIMTYYNPLYKYGVKNFFQKAKKVGLDGVIITDILPNDEKEVKEENQKNNISLIYLVAPTTTDERIKCIDKLTTSFIYCISRTGVTGEQKELDNALHNFMKRVRKISDKPLAVGFGISSAEQAKKASKIADAVIVGSAIVKFLGEKNSQMEMEIKNLVGEIKNSLKSDG